MESLLTISQLMGPDSQLGGIHPGGCNVLFADSSVRFVSESIELQALAGMATIAGYDVETNNEQR